MEEWSAGAEEVTILSIMCDSGLVPSKREARRLIDQGAVTVDGEKVLDITENSGNIKRGLKLFLY